MLPEISARRSLLEPSIRYLSPGREGEKCRPLDHMWQTPFVHSARLIIGSNSYIYNSILLINSMWYVQVCLVVVKFNDHACALAETLLFEVLSHYKSCVFSIWYALVHTGTKYMTSTHVHSLYKQDSPLYRLDFFFAVTREDIVRHNINAEKPKFYISTLSYCDPQHLRTVASIDSFPI